MAPARPFRFGIQLSNAPSGPAWADLARKAEDLGYDTLFMPDHFGDQLGPVPALMAAADATTELKVGALVFDNDYKHPVVLAKELATIDVLSGGRLIVGIGAGWMASDYEQSGIPMDPPGVRVTRMEEGIAVLKGCFADGPFSFTGEHYTISEYDAQPKPVQSPPPMLIGGGAKRVLSIAAREAQIVGINPSIHSGHVDAAAAQNGAAAETDKKIAWVREAAGDGYDELEINILQFAGIVTDDRKGTAEMMAPLFGLPPEELETYPHVCIGTVDEICESLEMRRERWDASYFVFQGDTMEPLAPVVAKLRGSGGTVASVTDTTTAWMDRAWDDQVGLLWNPPGSFEGELEPWVVHLVRETTWYAIGLLRRDGQGDRARAFAALSAVIDQQYDEPRQPWHGTFVRFPEWPAPADGATEWIDYDPNWRQFVGTALAVASTDFDLPSPLAARARAAIELAVTAEPPERVPPTYSNIALLRAWLETWAGRPQDGYAAAVVDAFLRHGCFTEYGSPTYYGIDLLALGLWQRPDSTSELRRDGARLETALWTDIARWWHAGLGNLCGPYSRAYGMDLHAYVGGLSLALWCAGLPAPLPSLDADLVPHGHDVCMAPMLDHVGLRVPTAARSSFEGFSGAHAARQIIESSPRREASGWLEDALMIGGEDGDSGLQARGQFHPASVHWRQPDGTVGWLRVDHHGPTRARADERHLMLELLAHPRRGPQPVRWITNAMPLAIAPDRWRLPGLDIEIETSAAPTPSASLSYSYSPASEATFSLRTTPTG